MPSNNPSAAIAIVFANDPCESADVATSARSTIVQYSGAPIWSAADASIGEKSAMNTTLMQPATNALSAAMQSAGPVRPLRAIGCPSRQITTELGSPGMLSIMAVVEPA